MLTQSGLFGADAAMGPQADLLVLFSAPPPLQQDIVSPAPLAVHSETGAVLLEANKELRGIAVRAQQGYASALFGSVLGRGK